MKRFILAGAATMALLCSAAASAHVDIGISIGIPGIVVGGPPVIVAEQPYYYPRYYPSYYPGVRYVQRPPVVVVQEPDRRWRRHKNRDYWGHHDNGHHGYKNRGRGHDRHH